MLDIVIQSADLNKIVLFYLVTFGLGPSHNISADIIPYLMLYRPAANGFNSKLLVHMPPPNGRFNIEHWH